MELEAVTSDNIAQVMARLKVMRDKRKEAEAEAARLKEAIDAQERAVLGFLIRTNQDSIAIRGLYTASVRKETVYNASPEFVEWALANDRTCVSIRAKNSGIRDLVEEYGEIPAGVTTTSFYKLQLTKR